MPSGACVRVSRDPLQGEGEAEVRAKLGDPVQPRRLYPRSLSICSCARKVRSPTPSPCAGSRSAADVLKELSIQESPKTSPCQLNLTLLLRDILFPEWNHQQLGVDEVEIGREREEAFVEARLGLFCATKVSSWKAPMPMLRNEADLALVEDFPVVAVRTGH